MVIIIIFLISFNVNAAQFKGIRNILSKTVCAGKIIKINQGLQSWGLKSLNLSKQKSTKLETSIVVAVIDTGLDIKHEAFKGQLWNNPGESGFDKSGNKKSSNGIDDDGNGYVDDIHGWNFVTNHKDVQDQVGHGTHISGIIAGKAPCGKVTGVAPNVKIMTLKYYEPGQSGKEAIQKSVLALEYAIKMGANIINYSGGGSASYKREKEILVKARSKGIILVAAAGNENNLADSKPYYPASYELDNILSVAAIDEMSRLASFSNYGPNKVDIAGPGVKIWSALPGNRYGFMSGTSQATAYLSGVVALVLEQNPGFNSPKEVIERIQFSRKKILGLKEKIKFSGITDVSSLLSSQGAGDSLSGGRTQNNGIMHGWFIPNKKGSILNFEREEPL